LHKQIIVIYFNTTTTAAQQQQQQQQQHHNNNITTATATATAPTNIREVIALKNNSCVLWNKSHKLLIKPALTLR